MFQATNVHMNYKPNEMHTIARYSGFLIQVSSYAIKRSKLVCNTVASFGLRNLLKTWLFIDLY